PSRRWQESLARDPRCGSRGRDHAGRAARAADNSRGADGRRVPRRGRGARRGRNLVRRPAEQQLERWRELDFDPATCGAGRNRLVRGVVAEVDRVFVQFHVNRQHELQRDRAALYLRDRRRFNITGALTGMGFFNGATANGVEFAISDNGNLSFRDNTGAVAVIRNTNFGSTSFFNTSGANAPIGPGQAVAGSLISNDNGGTTSFFQQSNAFGATITNNLNGTTKFFDSSTAFDATITNNTNGVTIFGNTLTDTPSAGDSTILNNSEGRTDFNGSSMADHATITTISGGLTNFNDMSTADHATITNDGGQTIFGPNTKAGSAQIINQNGGQTIFFGTAASATITNTSAGQTVFAASGRAGSANITNTQLGGPGAGGTTQFFDSSTADHA